MPSPPVPDPTAASETRDGGASSANREGSAAGDGVAVRSEPRGGGGAAPGSAVAAPATGVAGRAFVTVPALIAFVVAVVFLSQAGDISGPEATYPVVLAIAVLVIGAVNLVRDLLVGAPAGEEGALTRTAVLRLLAFVVVLVAALVLLEPLGFFPSMVVMVVGGLVCFGVRNPLVIAAAAALIVGFSYLVFVRLLVVPFPPGFLGLT